MSKTFAIPLAVFALALLAGSAMAQTDDGIRFGIRPTEAFEDRPETFSYFSHELAPGAVLSDAALVVNSGFVPVSLNLYAADGITAVNAGTAFARKGQDALGHSRGTREWLSFSDTEFRLEGAEELTVPFTITVPPDALPGHHVAGLVVEAPPGGELAPGGPGDGQFAAIVVQQAAVAVVIDVPGPHVAGLEITSTCMKTQGDLGATFVVGVHNTGNILLKGEGALSLMDRDGTKLASVPLEMDTVLPGDFTTFQVDHPVRLGDGEYRLSDVLNYEGKTAELGEQEFTIKDGQPEVGCDAEEDAQPPASFIEIISPLSGRGSSSVRLAIYGGAALALVLMILALIRRRRARRAGPKEPPRGEPPSGPSGGSDGTPSEAQPRKAMKPAGETPSFARRILALIPSRRARASGPEQLPLPTPESSSTGGSDETAGEAQPTKAMERSGEQPSFARRILALIPGRRAGASEPEQLSLLMPRSSSIGDPDGTPGEAQPQDDDLHSEAKVPSPATFSPPARRAKSDRHPVAKVTPPPQPPDDEADQKPDVAEPTVAKVTPPPQPPDDEADQKPDVAEPTVAKVTPPPQPPDDEADQKPDVAEPTVAAVTPPREPVTGGDELPPFLLKQLERSSSSPAAPAEEDSASSETAAEEQQEEQSAA